MLVAKKLRIDGAQFRFIPQNMLDINIRHSKTLIKTSQSSQMRCAAVSNVVEYKKDRNIIYTDRFLLLLDKQKM